MKPILFRVFDYPVSSYAVLMTLGYVVALGVLYRLTRIARARGVADLPFDQVWDLYIVMVVSSVLGSKVAHALFEAPGHVTEDGRTIQSFGELLAYDPWHFARLGEGGYVWYGGLLGGLFTSIFYFWRRPHLPAWLYADLFAPAIPAGAVVGRMGCLLAGCCHGRPTDLPIGLSFPRLPGPVHPTQIYDATVALVLAILLSFWFFRRRFNGQNICLLLMSYALLRTITESFRGDADRGSFGPLSTSQWISVPLFASGLFLYRFLKKRPVG